MHRLVNPVMGYAWGSRTAIAELQGRPPSSEPEAELWLGAHAKAPSRVGERSLDELIAHDPTRLLGARTASRFYGQLPFLLKVLAAEQPLSLQVHPSREQARAGFDRENALGIALDAEHRSYRDPQPKPELVCALTPFTALSGFRERRDTIETLRCFGLRSAAEQLESGDYHAALRALVETWLRTEDRAQLVAPVRARADDLDSPEAETTKRLAALHPDDPGVLVALLLRRFVLAPGHALALAAGNLHAYLDGVAIEVMASSDNVLRGGLTPKHVDVEELLRVLRFDAPPPTPILAHGIGRGRHVYHTDFSEFVLERYDVAGESPRRPLEAAALVLVTGGTVTVSSAESSFDLGRGDSVFVGAFEAWLQLEGRGVAFVATVPGASA